MQAPEVAAAVFVPAIPLFLAVTLIIGGTLSSQPPVVPDPIRLLDESEPPLPLDEEEERPYETYCERQRAYEDEGYDVVVSGSTSVTMSKPVDPSDPSKGTHNVTLVRGNGTITESISVQDADGYPTATVEVGYEYGVSVYGTSYRRSTTVVTTRIVNHRSTRPTYYTYVSVNGVQVETSCFSVFGDMDNDNDGVPGHLDQNDLDPTVGAIEETGGSSGGSASGQAGGGGTSTNDGGGDGGGGTVTDGSGGTVKTGDGSDLQTGS